MMRKLRLREFLGLALSVAVFTAIQLQSEAKADDWLAGKTIRIMVGYPPGGGHDLESRVIGRHLSQHLPGKPSIIVQNMPGAGGMIQAGYVYNRAKADGRTIGLFGGSHTSNAILRSPQEIKFDMSKMSVVWAVSGVDVDMVRDFLNAKNAKQLLKVDPEKIVIGGRSKGGSSCIQSQLALSLMEIKGYKVVCAYAGTAVIRGAMERGEVSFFNGSDAHLIGNGAFVDMYQRKLVYPVWQGGLLKEDGTIVRSPTVNKDVPTLFEAYKEIYGKTPSGPIWSSWEALTLGLSKLTRSLVLPPGTPPDRVETLRKGIKEMARDPKFVSDWERVFGQELSGVFVSAEEATMLKNKYLAPASWQDWLKKFVWG